MIPFGLAVSEWTAATLAPAVAGLSAAYFLGRRVGPAVLSGFGLGVFLWFFVDGIQGSANLDVFAGLSFTTSQFTDVALFVLGALLVFLYGERSLRSGATGFVPGVAVLAALAVGVHGFGEGSAFGATASLTSSADVLQAFGGVQAGAAYVLHKALETMMVASAYVAHSTGGKPATRNLGELSALAVLFALPSAVGAVLGYFIDYDAGYGFALGTGTSLFVLALLAKAAFGSPRTSPRREMAVPVAVMIGFMLIYVAALLHQ